MRFTHAIAFDTSAVHSDTQAIRDIATSSFAGPDNADNVSSLKPIVSCYWVSKLDPWKLCLLHLVPDGNYLKLIIIDITIQLTPIDQVPRQASQEDLNNDQARM